MKKTIKGFIRKEDLSGTGELCGGGTSAFPLIDQCGVSGTHLKCTIVYEIEEQKIELTKSQVLEAIKSIGGSNDDDEDVVRFIKNLGFKDENDV